MNRLQKLACFNLIVITATIIIITTVIAIELQTAGYSTIGPYFVAILALLRLNPFLFKKPQGRNKIVCDERDNFIQKRALSFAYTTFWIVLVLSCFLLWLILGPKSSVPTITLPLMAVGGALFMKIVGSVAILVQYGRPGKGGRS
ncbi:MAG TPA: hypothetical protein VMW16_11950 [Sedimentisphaerales bacterium]|nr:hypothetical protein [Sedimentisphaerales bacterium]